MVNTGNRSSGCASCRARRVKCDESKPECQKCMKQGKPCPGYKRELQIKLYNDPSKPPRKKQCTFGKSKFALPKSLPRQALVQTQKSYLDDDRSDSTPPKPSAARGKDASPKLPEPSNGHAILGVPSSLAVDIGSRSTDLFVASFVVPTERKYEHPLFLDFMPEMYLVTPTSSCLHHTFAAVARLNFVNRYKASNLSTWTTESYAKALSATNHALSNVQTAYTDETLASVWLLSLFEVLLSDTEPHNQIKPTPWRDHVNGTLGLLLQRGSQQLSTTRGRQLFILVHTTAMIMTMVAGKRPPEDLRTLIHDFLETAPKNFGKGELLVSQYLQDVTTARFLLNPQHSPSSSPESCTSQAEVPSRYIQQVLDDNQLTMFEAWTLTVPEWQPQAVSSSTRNDTTTQQFSLYYFSSTFIMANWVTYWAARLILLQCLLDSVVSASSTPSTYFSCQSESEDQPSPFPQITVHERLQERLNAAADSILGTLSFAFNEIDTQGERTETSVLAGAQTAYTGSAVRAIHCFWPLAALLASHSTSKTQKLLARDALAVVGGRFGVAQALKYI